MKIPFSVLMVLIAAAASSCAAAAAAPSANLPSPVIPRPAAHPGDEVVIVYNSLLPESKAVAEHYATRRQVPASQVFGFPLSTNEDVSRAEFRDSLQLPLNKTLEDKKLWHVASRIFHATTNHEGRAEWRVVESKIRYAVLCYGVPLRILSDPNFKEPAADKLRPELRRNEAAVDSELTLLPLVEEKLPLAGPIPNLLYAATNETWLHPTNGVVLVARLDGPTPAIARGLVDKALEAEKDGLWGRAYFDLRGVSDPGYKLGDTWIRSAADLCRRLGFPTVLDENPGTFPPAFPMDHIAYYLGWYDSDVSGPFAQPTVEFMPGAFAYHLHSYSAPSLRTTNRFWAGPLLAKGATATMGCVHEPYLGGTPDLAVFTERFILNGFTFGEAACASQSVLSWQTTVIGDPLYRPFGTGFEQQHQALVQSRSKLLEWSLLRWVNLNMANGKSAAEAVAVLDGLAPTHQSAILSEKLGDLYLAQGKPSSATLVYEQALKLDPSPQQRVRLLLTLAEQLLALEREPEAYADYQQLVHDYPDYPDKLAIYKKLLPLAQKLKKSADADQYQAEIARLTPPPPSPRPTAQTNSP